MTDARDRSDAQIVAWEPAGRAARRNVFEPHSDGGWVRSEQVMSHDGTWREVGSERVERVWTENIDGDH